MHMTFFTLHIYQYMYARARVCVCVCVCVSLSLRMMRRSSPAAFHFLVTEAYYLLPSARKLIYIFFLLASCFLVLYKNVSSRFRHFSRIFSYSNFRTQHFVVQFVEMLIERTCVMIIFQNHQQVLT